MGVASPDLTAGTRPRFLLGDQGFLRRNSPARGSSNREIAAGQSIAPATVRDYVSSHCQKLAAANRTEVVTKAIAMGLIKPDR